MCLPGRGAGGLGWGGRFFGAGCGDSFFDLSLKCGWKYRLGQASTDAQFRAKRGGIELVGGGQDDYRQSGQLGVFPHEPGYSGPIHSRHLVVEEYQIIVLAAERRVLRFIERFGPARYELRASASTGKKFIEYAAVS